MPTEQIFYYALAGILLFMYLRKMMLARSLNNYTGAEAKERVSGGSIMLDVRTSDERKRSSIPSSLHIPLSEISSRLSELENYRGKEIICYCASGNRSVSAALKLKKAGFMAGNLRGGISSWNF